MNTDSTNGKYIIRPRMINLLNRCKNYKITFLSADIGWGKSVAVSQWAKTQIIQNHWINIKEQDKLSSIKMLLKCNIEEDKEQLFIIDNFDLLIESEEYFELIELISRSSHLCRFVILSRSMLPNELKPFGQVYQLEIITEEELGFQESEIQDFFLNNNYCLETSIVNKIKEATGGWGLALNIVLYTLKQRGESFHSDIFVHFREELYSYLDHNPYMNWAPGIRKLFVTMSLFDEFRAELIFAVTGFEKSPEIIKNFGKRCKGIATTFPDTYRLSTFMKDYLYYRRNLYLDQEEIQSIYRKAGAWYEAARNMNKAFDFYHRVGSYVKMIELLEESSEHYLYTENFDDLGLFYESLPEDIIMKSPVLCGNMVCLYTICYRREEADFWFRRLLSMEESIPLWDEDKKRRLKERIQYISMILPETDDKQLLKTLKTMVRMQMPPALMSRTSLTANLPSLLRGYKDFSNWSNHTTSVMVLMKPVLESLFQVKAVGAVDIYIAETLYEKNHLNASLLEVTKGISSVEQGGTPELIYAGYTLLAKIMAANGQIKTSRSILANILKKIQNVNKLILNYRATVIRFDLLEGRKDSVAKWFENIAPDLNHGFRIFDSYQYLTKAKAYLYTGKYLQAIADLERLTSFFTEYRRSLDLIECWILQAIAFDRIGEEGCSMDRLGKALQKAQRYRFTRVFADEGGVCYGLLIKYSKLRDPVVKESFLKEVIDAAKSMVLLYPQYLIIDQEAFGSLTRSEMEVLQLLERGMSNTEAAEFLNISIDTIKFHIKNIYSKLSVKNRIQAVNRAKEYKIL